MMAYGYLNNTVQKDFVNGISGCTEHHIKLLSIINEACLKHKALPVCWLALANAYCSVQHGLIHSLSNTTMPVANGRCRVQPYQGLVGVVRIKEWSTEPFPMQVRVYQGYPLSVIIFNTVINTLVDNISQSHHQLSYSIARSNHQYNLLRYADDTPLLAH